MKTLRLFLICLFLTLSGFSNSSLAQSSISAPGLSQSPKALEQRSENHPPLPPLLREEHAPNGGNEIFGVFEAGYRLEYPKPQKDERIIEPSELEMEAASSFWCGYNPDHAALLADVTEESWSSWISRLSGEEEVVVSGQPVTITTRTSSSLFNGTSPAFTYLRETVEGLGYLPTQIEEDPYTYNNLEWKNLILTIPGMSNPNEIVILSAHYDSTSSSATAPGADDNGSGSAALLEAARILKGQSLARTIKLIWFTGEEQGLRGSAAYAADHNLSGVVGVINLDMYAYDNDNDRCFELHVGTLPLSQEVGSCITQAITSYDLGLSYDFLTAGATNRSDHASFWAKNVGAVEILENFFDNYQVNGCNGIDVNPNYHRSTDTLDKINKPTSLAITKAALASAIAMAAYEDPVADTTSPELVSSTITTEGPTLKLVLTINEPSTVKLMYGFAPGDYPLKIDDSFLNVQHLAIIDGVTGPVTYYFRVDMTDRAGNTATSDEFAFTDPRKFSYFPFVQKRSE